MAELGTLKRFLALLSALEAAPALPEEFLEDRGLNLDLDLRTVHQPSSSTTLTSLILALNNNNLQEMIQAIKLLTLRG